jgi:hypothetical protein
MCEYSISVNIDAPVARVWAATIDIERWPDWTPTVIRARRHESGPILVGNLVTIHQPKLPPALWKVSALELERHVELKSGFPGMFVIAHHQLVPHGDKTRLTLNLHFEGWLGKWMGKRLANLNNRYLALEAMGIKKYCERTDSPFQ